MGFLDDLSGKLNRGAEITARTGKSIKLKASVAEKTAQRNAACVRLGELAYELYIGDPVHYSQLREPAEEMRELDAAIAAAKAEVERLATQSAPSKATVMGICPACGYRPDAGAAFCSRCGAKISRDGSSEDAAASGCGEAPIDVEPADFQPAWASAEQRRSDVSSDPHHKIL